MKTWISSADLLTCARGLKDGTFSMESRTAQEILSIDSVLAAAERLYKLECFMTKCRLAPFGPFFRGSDFAGIQGGFDQFLDEKQAAEVADRANEELKRRAYEVGEEN